MKIITLPEWCTMFAVIKPWDALHACLIVVNELPGKSKDADAISLLNAFSAMLLLSAIPSDKNKGH